MRETESPSAGAKPRPTCDHACCQYALRCVVEHDEKVDAAAASMLRRYRARQAREDEYYAQWTEENGEA